MEPLIEPGMEPAIEHRSQPWLASAIEPVKLPAMVYLVWSGNWEGIFDGTWGCDWNGIEIGPLYLPL